MTGRRGGYAKSARPKNGRISSTHSATRSATLKGRESKRKGEASVPRAAQLLGLTPRPKPDPNLKPWPKDCVQIVAATPMTVHVASIREQIVDKTCADCRCRLAVDNHSIRIAHELPERQRRPLRFICAKCCLTYDRSSIERLIDHRRTNGRNEGAELDE